MSGRGLTKAQKDKVAQFCGVTGAPAPAAAAALAASGWALAAAVDRFYSSGGAGGSSSSAPRVDRAKIDALFERYREKDGDDNAGGAPPASIQVDGIVALCADLGVEPEDPAVLVFACHCGAAAMGELTAAEFARGLTALGADSVAALRARLPALRAELAEPARFREVYDYAFSFCREPGRRAVELDVALGMWRLLLPLGAPGWAGADDWLAFMEARGGGAVPPGGAGSTATTSTAASPDKAKRPVPRDLWLQVLDFGRGVGDDLDAYDDAGAWPYLLDEFVDAQRARRGRGGGGGGSGGAGGGGQGGGAAVAMQE